MISTHGETGLHRRAMLGGGLGLAALVASPRAASAQRNHPWKLATPVGTDTPTYKAYSFLADRIAAYTKGAITIQIFPNGQFGGQPEAYKDLGTGRFEISGIDASATFADVPKATLLQLPYVYNAPASASRIWQDARWMAPINGAFADRGYKVLSWFNLGVRQLGGTKPYAAPNDLAGVKVRILNSPLFVSLFKALGATPVSLAPAETYLALQQGIVQAYDQPLSNIISWKWFEAGKQVTLSQHVYAASFLGVNAKVWAGLSAPVQDAVQKAALEFSAYNDKLMAEDDEKSTAWLRAQTVTVTAADIPAYRAKMGPVYEAFASAVGGADVIRQFIAAQG
ncbi:MAG TPA: TRAP transporter substrate-binding protein [Devosiaceae bacterium]